MAGLALPARGLGHSVILTMGRRILALLCGPEAVDGCADRRAIRLLAPWADPRHALLGDASLALSATATRRLADRCADDGTGRRHGTTYSGTDAANSTANAGNQKHKGNMKALIVAGLVCVGLFVLLSGHSHRRVWFGRVVWVEPVHLVHWRR